MPSADTETGVACYAPTKLRSRVATIARRVRVPSYADDHATSLPGVSGYSGKLELTWTNKGQRLLAREDGGYEWAKPHDHRVREVRLLGDAGTIGIVGEERGQDNLLIRGDSLNGLTSLVEIPEFRDVLVGKVKLIYIDPPFNTGQAFTHYDDGLEHSVWLTMMRDRLLLLKQLLAPDGSIWVHLDDAEMAYCRVLMDEVFQRENFAAAVIWEKTDSPRMDAGLFSSRHDTMLVYRASPSWVPRPLVMDPDEMEHFNLTAENGRRYRRVLLRKWGSNSLREDRPNLYFAIEAPDGTEVFPIRSDGREGCWRWGPARVKANREDLDWQVVDGRLQPYVRQWADDATSRPPETIWFAADTQTNRQAKQEIKRLFPGIDPFDTPKPERLLQRVIHVATDPGDIVLDCFAGSGTTAAVAHKMGRRWITIEAERATVETFTAPRLEKVVDGSDRGGVSEEAGWTGGGGFRVLDVAPSMFEEDAGTVVLSQWATNSGLAEATAAQLGFDYEPDGLFSGRRGRVRLAVVDGHLTKDLVALLLSALGEKERLSVVSVGLDPAAAALLEQRRPGSRARTVPRDILLSYQSPSAWRVPAASATRPQPESSIDDAHAQETLEQGSGAGLDSGLDEAMQA